jgi:Spy/CpxP family protein refolding chaperone
MTTRRLLPAAIALATAALVAAGCGGGGSDQPSVADAQSAYQSIRTQVSNLGNAIGAEITNASRENDAQLSDAFDALQARGQAAVQRLQALDLPNDLTAKRDALRDALRRGTSDLHDIARAAGAHDAAAARDAVQQLIADSQTIRSARAAFENALAQARG